MIEGLEPYGSYKDSEQDWVGRIPLHWELKRGRAAFTEKSILNTGLREKTVLSLSYGRIKIKPQLKQHGLVPTSYETHQIVEPGDIIIRGTDLQNDKTSLRIGLVGTRGVISSAYVCLETRTGIIPEFGYQLLNAFDLSKAIYRYGSGLRQNLSYADVKGFPIFIPPVPEQVAITRFLSYADQKFRGFIATKRKLIALLHEQKKIIIEGAVTTGVEKDVPTMPSGIRWLADIPAHWGKSGLSTCLEKLMSDRPPEERNCSRSPTLQVSHLAVRRT